jgi:predicted nucleic acid-binding protein
MPNKVYVDTNIVVDLCDATRPAATRSKEHIADLVREDVSLFVNADSLSNLFYVLQTRTKMSLTDVLKKMREVYKIFELVVTEKNDIDQALSLCEDPDSDFKDYEDALQYVCARKIGAGAILTNDQGFVSPDVPVWRS